MSANYLYDGTFAGLLSVAALLLEGGEPPAAIGAEIPAQADLFTSRIEVVTDPAAAAKLRAALRERSPDAERTIACAFLAAAPGKEVAVPPGGWSAAAGAESIPGSW